MSIRPQASFNNLRILEHVPGMHVFSLHPRLVCGWVARVVSFDALVSTVPFPVGVWCVGGWVVRAQLWEWGMM